TCPRGVAWPGPPSRGPCTSGRGISSRRRRRASAGPRTWGTGTVHSPAARRRNRISQFPRRACNLASRGSDNGSFSPSADRRSSALGLDLELRVLRHGKQLAMLPQVARLARRVRELDHWHLLTRVNGKSELVHPRPGPAEVEDLVLAKVHSLPNRGEGVLVVDGLRQLLVRGDHRWLGRFSRDSPGGLYVNLARRLGLRVLFRVVRLRGQAEGRGDGNAEAESHRDCLQGPR